MRGANAGKVQIGFASSCMKVLCPGCYFLIKFITELLSESFINSGIHWVVGERSGVGGGGGCRTWEEHAMLLVLLSAQLFGRIPDVY